MRIGIITKLSECTIRIVVFGPALMGFLAAVESVYRPTSWYPPMSRFWHLPLLNGAFALLCIIPYFGVLLRRPFKWVFLAAILLTLAFKFRYELLPFHYAAPQLGSHPEYAREFDDAKHQPNGSGFSSHRELGGELLWLVKKSDYSVQNLVISCTFYLVPLALFAMRAYELRRGITWRNFMRPTKSGQVVDEPAAPAKQVL